MVLDYLTPTLVVVALISFYALSRVLLKNEVAALLTGSVCALFFMAYVGPGMHVFGGELIGRAAEDKFVARFAFLPVALIFAVLFLEYRRYRYLGLFALVVWAVVVVHPVGLAIIGLSVGSFCLFYLLANLRQMKAWTGTAALGAVLASVVAPPAILLLTGGEQSAALYSADINSGDPRVLANMVFVRPEWRHILELENGYYIMHPYLLLNPAIAIAYVVGLPFLALRLRRSLAAPLLLGILVVVTVLVYVPPVATFFGNEVIIPGQLWRMAWPIPLAALLTLQRYAEVLNPRRSDGWAAPPRMLGRLSFFPYPKRLVGGSTAVHNAIGWPVWEAVSRMAARLNRSGLAERRTKYLPVLLVLLLTLAVMPLAISGAREVRVAAEPTVASGYPADPIFPWMRENVEEPAVVLASDAENTTIPAYSSSASVVSLRGGAVLNNLPALEKYAGENIQVPRRILDVQQFYYGPTFEEAFKILRRYEVDYIMVYRDTVLEEQLQRES